MEIFMPDFWFQFETSFNPVLKRVFFFSPFSACNYFSLTKIHSCGVTKMCFSSKYDRILISSIYIFIAQQVLQIKCQKYITLFVIAIQLDITIYFSSMRASSRTTSICLCLLLQKLSSDLWLRFSYLSTPGNLVICRERSWFGWKWLLLF